MITFDELLKIKNGYDDRINEICEDILSKIDIQIGDVFIPFNYDKGNACFILTEDYKPNCKVIFDINTQIVSIKFTGKTVCYNNRVYENDSIYCGFTMNEHNEWVIKDNRFNYIEPYTNVR